MQLEAIKPFTSRHKISLVILFFLTFLVLGLSIYRDYGISWDESVQRTDNGLINYNYIFKGDADSLIKGNEKYHGPVFEIFLILVEKAFHLEKSRDIYFMRHLLTFLTFFISTIFFFLTCIKSFKSWSVALIGTLMLILSPRIFADSFYNSKDLVFLSLFIISTYTLLLFYEDKSYRNAIIHSLSCAILIDTRVLGIIIPLLTFGLIVCDWIISIIKKEKYSLHIKTLLIYSVFLCGLTILFWPILWEGPVSHFVNAFTQMKKYHWNGVFNYWGKTTRGSETPWHYIPVWMVITTPIYYSFLFIISLGFLIARAVKNPFLFFIRQKNEFIFLLLFFLPLLSVIFFKSVLYDGWRHLFFIYPSFLLVAIRGGTSLYQFINAKFKKAKHQLRVKIVLLSFLVFSFIETAVSMISIHPFEFIYFNSIASRNMKAMKDNFMLDYWGPSCRQGLEYILAHDTSEYITFYALEQPFYDNLYILTEDQKKRIKQRTNYSEIDYFLTIYRWDKKPGQFPNEFYSFKIGNEKFLTIYKLKQDLDSTKIIHSQHLALDFENYKDSLRIDGITNEQAHSGLLSFKAGSWNQFSPILEKKISEIADSNNVYITASVWAKLIDSADESARLVISIENKSGPYSWNHIPLKDRIKKTNQWGQVNYRVDLRYLHNVKPGDWIKVYIYNPSPGIVYVDDLNVNYYSLKK